MYNKFFAAALVIAGLALMAPTTALAVPAAESSPTTTPHISCQPQDFAPTVIMPGDPKRSEFIAKNYLTNAKLVNDVRGIQGYTGTYKGKPISVMASGMGGPSMGIYSHELFAFMNVQRIIRVGTMSTFDESLRVGDIVLAEGACYNSNFMSQFQLNGCFAPIADFQLLRQAAEFAETKGLNYKVGNVLTSDFFYSCTSVRPAWKRLHVLGAEMETAILYANAALHQRQALSILTISEDNQGGSLTPEEREAKLNDAIEMALSLNN